ncbi:MAG: arginine deiminase family protein, partial [Candidatus Neomarinimicrobiota bacterium]
NPIRRILLKHPENAYHSSAEISAQWKQLNYISAPDYDQARNDYDHFVSLLNLFNMEINFLPKADSTGLDSIYTHDPCITTNGGIVLCSMGKPERAAEPEALGDFLTGIGIPILGSIKPPATLEGGDVVWIDERTVAVGEGYRTNAAGISQFRELLGDLVDDLISVSLPHWDGPLECLHLMSNLSPVDHDLFLVYSRLLPINFRNYLLDRNIQLVEVPDTEYVSMGCNVLTVSPRKCIMLAGNPITRQLLQAEGVEIHTYSGAEISIKGAGGPTCLTRPLLRTVN